MASKLEKFADVIERAAERKGGLDVLYAMAGVSADGADGADFGSDLTRIPDDRWLSQFTKQIFQSGFVWRVVEQKWPGFEEVFFEFDIEKMLMMPDELWEAKCKDERIIRNGKKVMCIKDNAQMIYEVAEQHGSFGQFVTNWPNDDMIGLWNYIKKHGARLGGNTGPYALRFMGVDTFIVSRDNEAYFRAYKIIDGGINTKKSQLAIQDAFNQWHEETNLPYACLSRILSFSSGDNSSQLIS
jgi:3-methyladenine DNA glycosylase Tag